MEDALPNATLKLNGSYTDSSIKVLARQLAACTAQLVGCVGSTISVDLAGMTFIRPVAYAALAAWVWDRRLRGDILQVVKRPQTSGCRYDVDTYLDVAGFYRLCGGQIPTGCLGGADRGWLVQLLTCADQVDRAVSSLVESVSGQLSMDDSARRAIHIAMSEVMDNVFRHSCWPRAVAHVQTYRKQHRIEFCVADCGRGIRESLAGNPELPSYASDSDAIQAAMTKDITGSPNSNTGIGLFILRELVKQNNGHLQIVSGCGSCDIRGPSTMASSWQGVLVAVGFDLKHPLSAKPIYDAYWPEDTDETFDLF